MIPKFEPIQQQPGEKKLSFVLNKEIFDIANRNMTNILRLNLIKLLKISLIVSRNGGLKGRGGALHACISC